jgi:hypothetical protein
MLLSTTETLRFQNNCELGALSFRKKRSCAGHVIAFDKNVAGAILTIPEGCIADCNEACAWISGLDSKEEMLAHSAWDLYFNRAERKGS